MKSPDVNLQLLLYNYIWSCKHLALLLLFLTPLSVKWKIDFKMIIV